MANYDRYKSETAESYEKKGLMDYLVRIPSDKKLLPLISPGLLAEVSSFQPAGNAMNAGVASAGASAGNLEGVKD